MPLGPTELIIILVILLLLFGAKRLPELGRSLGGGMREFKDSVTSRGEDHDETAAIEPRRESPVQPTKSSSAHDHDHAPAPTADPAAESATPPPSDSD